MALEIDNIENIQNSSGVQTINQNFEKIQAELEKVLYKDGSNASDGNLDMDSNRILNLPDAITSGEPVPLRQSNILNAAAEASALRAKQFADIAASNQTIYETVAAGVFATSFPNTFLSNQTGTVLWYKADGTPLNDGPVTKVSLSQSDTAENIGVRNGNTVQNGLDNLAPTIWRKRPSLEALQSQGTPQENADRINAVAAQLASEGGGTITLVEDEILIDRPIILPPKVSIIGSGKEKTLIRNVHETYSAVNSSIFFPGSLHPSWTSNFYGNAGSKPINAAQSGDTGIVLSVSADTAHFEVGDYVIPLSAAFYLSGGHKIAEYMTIRRVIAISGSIVYLDEPLSDALPVGGFLHNLTRTNVTGDPHEDGGTAQRLFAWSDAEIAGFSAETIGNWMAPASGAYKVKVNDIDVRSRRIWYVNSFVHSTMDGVGGGFLIKAGEAALNCDHLTVRNGTAAYDAELNVQSIAAGASIPVGTPTGGFSAQENSVNVTWQNLDIDLTGLTGGSAVNANNTRDMRVDNVRMRNGSPAYGGIALLIGSQGTAAGRRNAVGTKISNLEWDGPCALYAQLFNGGTDRTEIDIRARGLLSGTNAVLITDVLGRTKFSEKSSFENGRLAFSGGTKNAEIIGCYIGDGVAALTGGNFSSLEVNDVRAIRTSKSAVRRGGTTTSAVQIDHTGTTDTTDVYVKSIGTAVLKPQDEFEWEMRLNITGTAGAKNIYARLRNDTSGQNYSLGAWSLGAGVSGVVSLNCRAIARALNLIVCTGITSSLAGITTTPGAATADLSNVPLSLVLSAQLGNASDSIAFTVAKTTLSNPVQN